MKDIKATPPSKMGSAEFQELIAQVLPIRQTLLDSEPFFEAYFGSYQSNRTQLYDYHYWWDYYLDHVDTIANYQQLAELLDISEEGSKPNELFVNYSMRALILARMNDPLAKSAAENAVNWLDLESPSGTASQRMHIWIARHWSCHEELDDVSIELLKLILQRESGWFYRPIMGDLCLDLCKRSGNDSALEWTVQHQIQAFQELCELDDYDRYGAETTSAGSYVVNLLRKRGRHAEALNIILDAQRHSRYVGEGGNHDHQDHHTSLATSLFEDLGAEKSADQVLAWLDNIEATQDHPAPPMPFLAGNIGTSNPYSIWTAMDMCLHPLVDHCGEVLLKKFAERAATRELTLNEMIVRELALPAERNVMEDCARIENVLHRKAEWKRLPPSQRLGLWFFVRRSLEYPQLDPVTHDMASLVLDAAAGLNGQLWWNMRGELLSHVERKEIALLLNEDAKRNWRNPDEMQFKDVEFAFSGFTTKPKFWKWEMKNDPAQNHPSLSESEQPKQQATKAELFSQMAMVRSRDETQLYTSLNHFGSLRPELVTRLTNGEKWERLRERWVARGENASTLYQAIADVLLPPDSLEIFAGNASDDWEPSHYWWENHWVWDESIEPSPTVFCLAHRLCQLAVETGQVDDLLQRMSSRPIDQGPSTRAFRHYWYLKYWLAHAQNNQQTLNAALEKLTEALLAITNEEARNNLAGVFSSYPLAIQSSTDRIADADQLYHALMVASGEHDLSKRYNMLMMSGSARHWLRNGQLDQIYEHWDKFESAAAAAGGSIACGHTGGGRWALRLTQTAIESDEPELAGRFLRLAMDYLRHREQANVYVYFRDRYRADEPTWTSIVKGMVLDHHGQFSPWIFDPLDPRTEGGCHPDPPRVELRAGADQVLLPLNELFAESGDVQFTDQSNRDTKLVKLALEIRSEPNSVEHAVAWQAEIERWCSLESHTVWACLNFLLASPECHKLIQQIIDRSIEAPRKFSARQSSKHDRYHRRLSRLAGHLAEHQSGQTGNVGLQNSGWGTRTMFRYDLSNRRIAHLNGNEHPNTDIHQPLGQSVLGWKIQGDSLQRSESNRNEQLHLIKPLPGPTQFILQGNAELFATTTLFCQDIHIEVKPYRCHLKNGSTHQPVFDEPTGWIAVIRKLGKPQCWLFFEPRENEEAPSIYELTVHQDQDRMQVTLNDELVAAFRSSSIEEHNLFLEFSSPGQIQIERLSYLSGQSEAIKTFDTTEEFLVKLDAEFRAQEIEHPGWRRTLVKTAPGIDSDRR